jgi:hypothetical protein
MGGGFLLSIGIAQVVFMEASPLPVKAAKTLAFQRMNYSKSYSYGRIEKTNDRPIEGVLVNIGIKLLEFTNYPGGSVFPLLATQANFLRTGQGRAPFAQQNNC